MWWKPTEDSARQFFILGLVSLVAYMGGYHWWRIATQPILIFCFEAGAIFLPAVSLHFFMIFPKKKLFLIRRPLTTFSVVYGVPFLFLFLMVTGYFRLRFEMPPMKLSAIRPNGSLWGVLLRLPRLFIRALSFLRTLLDLAVAEQHGLCLLHPYLLQLLFR